MAVLKSIVQYILNLGPGVFLPIIMLIIGLIVRMKFSKAFSAALTLGVAFVGMNVIINFMTGAVSPAAQSFVKYTGLKLTALDLGWTPVSAISWAWPYAFLMFPIQIVINLIMLAFNWTDCLNVDMWNVWNKVLTCVLVQGVTGSLTLAFIVGAIEVILELKNADLLHNQIYELTKIPGISLPHALGLTAVVLAPLNRLLDFIPGINKIKLDPETLKDKLGIFGENHILGFIIGVLIALFARYNLKDTLTLGVSAAAALTLFPMAATLFIQALLPISDAAGEFMKKRFPGREFYIGLDWPFLAGQSSLWVTLILLVPVTLAMAIILPGNRVLPFGGILNICFGAIAVVITGGNLIRMLILGIISTPLYMYVASYFAPMITNLAKTINTIKIPAGQLITWNGMEAPEFRYVFSMAANIFKGVIFPGLPLLIIYGLLYWWYFKYMVKKEKEAAERINATQNV